MQSDVLDALPAPVQEHFPHCLRSPGAERDPFCLDSDVGVWMKQVVVPSPLLCPGAPFKPSRREYTCLFTTICPVGAEEAPE